jgi:hypothetical protein
LRSRGINAQQEDIALALVLELFSPSGLQAIRKSIDTIPPGKRSPLISGFVSNSSTVIWRPSPRPSPSCRGATPRSAIASAGRNFLPEGPRFESLDVYVDDEGGDPLAWAFGALGVQDRARHLATLYLNDLADVLREAVDSRFEFVRYAESLAQSQPSFEPLARRWLPPPTLVDSTLQKSDHFCRRPQQTESGAAFRALPRLRLCRLPHRAGDQGARPVNRHRARRRLRQYRIARTEGSTRFSIISTTSRWTTASAPLACSSTSTGKRPRLNLVRTFARVDGKVRALLQHRRAGCPLRRSRHADLGRPAARPLPVAARHAQPHAPAVVGRALEQADRRPRLLLEKMQLLRCQPRLHRPLRRRAGRVAGRPHRGIIAETGQTGFHFVDEAAPPKALKALADELQKRNRAISWWGNIRFEKSFTPELCNQLADSGCIAVSGGLEVASDRLLT